MGIRVEELWAFFTLDFLVEIFEKQPEMRSRSRWANYVISIQRINFEANSSHSCIKMAPVNFSMVKFKTL